MISRRYILCSYSGKIKHFTPPMFNISIRIVSFFSGMKIYNIDCPCSPCEVTNCLRLISITYRAYTSSSSNNFHRWKLISPKAFHALKMEIGNWIFLPLYRENISWLMFPRERQPLINLLVEKGTGIINQVFFLSGEIL